VYDVCILVVGTIEDRQWGSICKSSTERLPHMHRPPPRPFNWVYYV